MKSIQFVLGVWIILFSAQVFSGHAIQVGISNIEDMSEKLKDLLAVELQKPITIPSTTLDECEKLDVRCLLGETQLQLASSAQDFDFKLEAMSGQTFIYTLELPTAVAAADFVIRGKVLGRVVDMKFKIQAFSVSTAKEDIDWLKGSGKIFLELKNNLFQASSINFPNWKIDHVRITPMDRFAKVFMSTFGRFADLETLALGFLNSQIQTYLQNANLHLTLAKVLNKFFANAPSVLASFENFGLNASLSPASFSTEQRQVGITLKSELSPTQKAHSCASGLEPNIDPPNFKMLLGRPKAEANTINVSWPVSFFEHAVYLMAKYPFLDRQGTLTPPILCQKGQSEIKILGKKQTLAYDFVPVKTIGLKSEEGDNSGNLLLNLWVELRGTSDKYPRLHFKRHENKKKIPGLLINIEAKLWLTLTERGLVFELKDLKINKVVGKAKLTWRFHLLSITVPLEKIKKDLEQAVIAYIENNMSRMVLLSPTIEISENHSLILSKVQLSPQKISSTFILK